MYEIDKTYGIAPSAECFTDYIKPHDYIRPVLGGATYGLLFGCFIAALISGTFPVAALFIIPAFGIAEAIVFGLIAFVHHAVWLYRLKKYGPSAFEQFIDLDLPQAQAFELALAATTNVSKSKIESVDDAKGTIILHARGNFWTHVDRRVSISLAGVEPRKTRLKVASIIKLTKARSGLIELVWGKKWYPILFRTDVNQNRKLMQRIVDFIHSVPDWDHSYIPAHIDKEAAALKESLGDGPSSGIAAA